MSDKLQKIKEIAQILDKDVPSTKEVAELIRGVLAAVGRVKTELESQMSQLTRSISGDLAGTRRGIKEVKDSLSKELSRLKDKQKEDYRALQKQIQVVLGGIEAKIPRLPDYSDLFGEIEDRFTALENSDLPEDVVRSEQLQRGLDEIKESMKKLRIQTTTRFLAPFGVRRIYQPHVERFTDQTDGVTKSFTLKREPLATDTIEVSGTDFPIILDPTVDFTVAGRVVTLTSSVPAPSSGSTLIIKYYA